MVITPDPELEAALTAAAEKQGVRRRNSCWACSDSSS